MSEEGDLVQICTCPFSPISVKTAGDPWGHWRGKKVLNALRLVHLHEILESVPREVYRACRAAACRIPERVYGKFKKPPG